MASALIAASLNSEDNNSVNALFTIGIPTFQRDHLLERALHSVASQSVLPAEVIVGDNGSSDRTESVVEKWKATLPMLRYVRRSQNLGSLRNMVELVKEARSERFLWLADDDVLHPNMLKVVSEFLEQNPDVQVLGWGFHVKNYISNQVDIPGKLPIVRCSDDNYTNCQSYIRSPQSPYFYSAYHRETLLKSILIEWSSSGKRFDWMDVAFVTYMLLNSRCHFIENCLVTYGVDTEVRPKRGGDGETVKKYNPNPWLLEGGKIILCAKTITPIEKFRLLSLFYSSWRTVAKNA